MQKEFEFGEYIIGDNDFPHMVLPNNAWITLYSKIRSAYISNHLTLFLNEIKQMEQITSLAFFIENTKSSLIRDIFKILSMEKSYSLSNISKFVQDVYDFFETPLLNINNELIKGNIVCINKNHGVCYHTPEYFEKNSKVVNITMEDVAVKYCEV